MSADGAPLCWCGRESWAASHVDPKNVKGGHDYAAAHPLIGGYCVQCGGGCLQGFALSAEDFDATLATAAVTGEPPRVEQ